jgi:hypothetical protein
MFKTINKIIKTSIILLLFFIPVFTFAQSAKTASYDLNLNGESATDTFIPYNNTGLYTIAGQNGSNDILFEINSSFLGLGEKIATPVKTVGGNEIIKAGTGYSTGPDGKRVNNEAYYVKDPNVNANRYRKVTENGYSVALYTIQKFGDEYKITVFSNEEGSRTAQNTNSVEQETNSLNLYNESAASVLKENFAVFASCGFKVDCWVANFAYHVIMTPAAWFLSTTGSLFDWSINTSIVNMAPNYFPNIYSGVLNNDARYDGAINAGWKIFRDMANILFIFILLYISISTIIGGVNGTGKKVATVIIVAILINFSMFFTKVVVDFSNTIAISFYNQITSSINPDESKILYSSDKELRQATGEKSSLAGVFIAKTRIATLYNIGSSKDFSQIDTSKSGNLYIIQQSMFGAVVMVILGIVLLFASILMFTRFIVLAFVLMLSSFALASYLIPQLKSNVFDKWFSALVGQAAVAPVFIAMIYISILFIEQTPILNTGAAGFEDVMKASTQLWINYAMVIGFIIMSLSIAKSLSEKAGKESGKITSFLGGAAIGTAAFAGRHTLGRGARALGNNIEGNTAFSRLAQRSLLGVGKSSFDARGIKGIDKVSGGMDVGKAGGKGGFDKSRSDAMKKRDERNKMYSSATGAEKREKLRLQEYITELEKKQKEFDTQNEREFKSIKQQREQAETLKAEAARLGASNDASDRAEAKNKQAQAKALESQAKVAEKQLQDQRENITVEVKTGFRKTQSMNKKNISDEIGKVDSKAKDRGTSYVNSTPITGAQREWSREQQLKAQKEKNKSQEQKDREEIARLTAAEMKKQGGGGDKKDKDK